MLYYFIFRIFIFFFFLQKKQLYLQLLQISTYFNLNNNVSPRVNDQTYNSHTVISKYIILKLTKKLC